MRRLSRCFTKWRGAEVGDIIAYVRFHPRGEIVSGRVVAPVRDQENPPGVSLGMYQLPFEAAVRATPPRRRSGLTTSIRPAADATHGTAGLATTTGSKWAVRRRESPRSRSYRSGAVTRPDMVNVLEQSAAKVNVFPPPAGDGSRRAATYRRC